MIPRLLLILWDIDGTLLTAGDNGRKAYFEAGKIIFGESFTVDGVDKLGRTDPTIWQDVVHLNGGTDSDQLENQFRLHYLQNLKSQIKFKPEIRLLAGIRELVDRLDKAEYITQGILSGNYPEAGRLKVETAGLDCELFKIWVGGTDGKSREDLISVARSRYADLMKKQIDMKQVIIIGDTPRDIYCAKANHCRCISVATGFVSRQTLEEAGAEIVFKDLSETDNIMKYINTVPYSGA